MKIYHETNDLLNNMKMFAYNFTIGILKAHEIKKICTYYLDSYT